MRNRVKYCQIRGYSARLSRIIVYYSTLFDILLKKEQFYCRKAADYLYLSQSCQLRTKLLILLNICCVQMANIATKLQNYLKAPGFSTFFWASRVFSICSWRFFECSTRCFCFADLISLSSFSCRS